MQMNCTDYVDFHSDNKDAYVNYTQTCEVDHAFCLKTKYADVPFDLQVVFQLVDASQSYSVCSVFQDVDTCQQYCTYPCKSIDLGQLQLTYNASVLQNKPEINVTYVDRFAFTQY